MEGEKVLAESRPHPLAFWEMYLVWAFVAAVSLSFIVYGEALGAASGGPMAYAADTLERLTAPTPGILDSIPYYREASGAANKAVSPAAGYARRYTAVGLWAMVLVVAALCASVVMVDFKWPVVMGCVAIASVLAASYMELAPEAAYYFGVLFSILGVCFVEVYRNAHRYYVTDMRVVTEVRFASHKRNELSYDKINNIVLDQGLLGSLFNFGTVIPVTASGLGMGGDMAAVTLAGARSAGPATLGVGVTGGRDIRTPRARSMHCLFGVPDPERMQAVISKGMHEYTEAPYLRRMTEQLDRINVNTKKE